MEDYYKELDSDIESVVDSLMAPTSELSCTNANQRISAIFTDYLAHAAACEDEYKMDSRYGYDPPGVSEFFWTLWGAVVDQVYKAPIETKAHDEHINRLVEFVNEVQANPQPEGDWLMRYEKLGWKDVPVLSILLRESYNERIDDEPSDLSVLLSPEGQAVVAGESPQSPDSPTARIAIVRHRMLSLQTFIARLWRDCNYPAADCAIWALRPGLEDWPEFPPTNTQSNSFEESPANLAFQVEQAALWIITGAPLMYECTEIWGPNGNPTWPENAGTPGRGGRRWKGVDGYDREHKRWEVWKGVLGEVIEWCDGERRVWKVRGAAIHALEVMKNVERR